MAKAFAVQGDFDPLGPAVADRLSATQPLVTPEQLLEVVTQKLEKELPGNLKGKARQRVLVFLAETEYRHDLKTHIQSAQGLRAAGHWDEKDANDNSDRIEAKARQYQMASGEEEIEEEEVQDVDQPVGPGNMTRLHIAAMDGERDEVVRLVEQEGARVDVLDNNKWTPSQRAHAMGHTWIERYLDGKAKEMKSIGP